MEAMEELLHVIVLHMNAATMEAMQPLTLIW
jgi:hypothetical protein